MAETAGKLSESTLIDLAKAGDVSAFETLISGHLDACLRLAHRMMGNAADAEDAVQEALIKAFRHFARFRGDSSLQTWLYRIVNNACLDALRVRKRQLQRHLSMDEPVDGEEGERERQWADGDPGPAEQYELAEKQRMLQRALDQLPEDFRSALVLRDIEGLSYEEIAELNGVTLGTVKSRIHRARSKLQELLLQSELFAPPSVQHGQRKEVRG